MGGMALTITQATTPMAMPGSPKSRKNGNISASVKVLLGKCFYPEKVNSAAKLSAFITWAVKVPLNGLEKPFPHSRVTGVDGRGMRFGLSDANLAVHIVPCSAARNAVAGVGARVRASGRSCPRISFRAST
jgi:hypothetical protein